MGWMMGWIDTGRAGMVSALRSAAATLEGLADWIEAPPQPTQGGRRDAVTRQRIAATLDRARVGYVRVTAPARSRR